VIRPKLLPWEYGVRNLLRRPGRTAMTFCALTTVILLVLVMVGFIRGLEASLATSGDPRVVLVHAFGMSDNLEYSAVAGNTPDLLTASLDGVRRRYGETYASPELYLATRVAPTEEAPTTTGLVRGVTPAVLRVRRRVEILDGNWPGPGEVLVGRMVATKLGYNAGQLPIGGSVYFEGRTWRISGHFAASGSVLESELWCRLDDYQRALRRQDLSLVALTLAPHADFVDFDLFCQDRSDLELEATRETDYYASLTEHYWPVRMLAWLVVWLVAAAGVFAALNTMYAAVVGRTAELAALQTVGFLRRAIAASLIQEAMLLCTAGSLAAAAIATLFINGMAIRFTMGAFPLRIDSTAILVGCGVGLLLGLFGALPPAIRAMRMPIVEGLRDV